MPIPPPRSARDPFLDYVKGGLIFLVTYGHCIQFVGYRDGRFWTDPVAQAIYMFHMPLFIAVSGYLSHASIRRTPWATLVGRRAGGLLVPAAAWAVVGMLMSAAQTRRFGPADLARAYGRHLFDLWFLWALFAATTAVATLRRLRCDGWIGLTAASLASLALPATPVLTMTAFTFPFFCLAYGLADGRGPARWASSPLALTAAALTAALVAAACWTWWRPAAYVYNSGMGLAHGNGRWVALRDVAGVALSYLAIRALRGLFRARFLPALATLGRDSLIVYAQQVYLDYLLAHVRVPLQNSRLFSVTFGPPIAVALCVVLVGTGRVGRRLPVVGRLLFGRTAPPERRSPPDRHAGTPRAEPPGRP